MCIDEWPVSDDLYLLSSNCSEDGVGNNYFSKIAAVQVVNEMLT